MLEESIAFCSGRETDARGTLEQTAKCLGFTYEALMQGLPTASPSDASWRR